MPVATRHAPILAFACALSLPVAHANDVAVEAACKRLVMAYAFHRDRPDADAVAALFTEDATFTLLGQTFSGREAIRARVAAGVNGPVFRHVMSTVHIEVIDPDLARGVSYVTVYQADPGPLPRRVGQWMAIGEYHDRFVRTAHGWKIAEREFVMALEPAAQ